MDQSIAEQSEVDQGIGKAGEIIPHRDLVSAILDTVASLIVILDREGRIIRFNRACEKTTGYTAGEVEGYSLWDLFLGPAERAAVKAVFSALAAGHLNQPAGHLNNHFENYWITKDGRRRLISWSNTILTDKDGEVEKIIATGTDITEGKQTALLLDTSESLQRVTTAVLHKLTTLNDVLNIVCSEARQLIGASGSAVLTVADQEHMRVAAVDGHPLPIKVQLSLHNTLAGQVLQYREPLLLAGTGEQFETHFLRSDIQSLLAVPLHVDERVLGVLEVVNKPGGFSHEDIQIMQLFADQAAIAIENTRLHEQGEHLAILKERQRLARELHDSVTQALYSVNLYVDATRMALAAGRDGVARENLEELRKMAREAMLDMRLLIFELRPPMLEQEGLAAALQARLEAVEARSGLQTAFRVEGECHLPLSAEEELYRIAQEALTNAVKHAHAQQVIIRLSFKENRFCLEIEDDGSGFNLADARQSGGLGLRGMEERIQRIGAQLEIESTPGAGTLLRIEGVVSK